MEQFDRLMVAVTFAQANLHGTALELMHKRSKKEKRKQSSVQIRDGLQAMAPGAHVTNAWTNRM